LLGNAVESKYDARYPGPFGRLNGWVFKRFRTMKIRAFLLALLAFTVLAGSVVPANAATHKHHKKHHHKK
jgi:hypothetical protein